MPWSTFPVNVSETQFLPGVGQTELHCADTFPTPHPVLCKTYFVFGSKHSHQNNFSLLIWFGYELSPKDSCTDRLDIGDIWSFLMSPCCALGFMYTMKSIPLWSMLLLLGLPRGMRPTSDWMFWNIESDVFPPLSCFSQEFDQSGTKAGNTMAFSQRDLSDTLWGWMTGSGWGVTICLADSVQLPLFKVT